MKPATLDTPAQCAAIFRESAARWRESAERWLDIARSALGDSDIHQVVGALRCVAERRQWAREDEAIAEQFLMQGRVRGTHESRKLNQPGSTPGPATSRPLFSLPLTPLEIVL